MATIKEIAEKLGISTTTVSNVIHGKTGKMSADTRKKIEEIDKLGLGKEEWLIIDRALSATNERCAEYGRVSYRQGFLDALSLIKR